LNGIVFGQSLKKNNLTIDKSFSQLTLTLIEFFFNMNQYF